MARTREQIEQAGRDAEAWLDNLDPAVFTKPEADATDLRHLAEATTRLANATNEQAEAVQRARYNGKTWTEIAAILGISRQAAKARFAAVRAS